MDLQGFYSGQDLLIGFEEGVALYYWRPFPFIWCCSCVCVNKR